MTTAKVAKVAGAVKEFARCGPCRWTLAEDLLGQLRCPHEGCAEYRKVVGTVPGVEVSPELVAALTGDAPPEQS